MSGTTSDGEPAESIRASDAERDAAVERLSAATGEGRLTLEEFSQRMERALAGRRGPDLPWRAGPAVWNRSAVRVATAAGTTDALVTSQSRADRKPAEAAARMADSPAR
jgi:hypothetical protein